MHKPNEIRCPNCNRKVAEALGATNISCVCPRCKTSFEFSNLNKDKVLIEAKIENQSNARKKTQLFIHYENRNDTKKGQRHGSIYNAYKTMSL